MATAKKKTDEPIQIQAIEPITIKVKAPLGASLQRLVKKYRRQLGDEQVRLCEGKQPEQTM